MKRSDSHISDRVITLSQSIDAPPSALYAAFTEIEPLSAWMASIGCELIEAAIDVRFDGRWHVLIRSPDGVQRRVEGVYRRVVPNECLMTTYRAYRIDQRVRNEQLVTVNFVAVGWGTNLEVHQAHFMSDEGCVRYRAAWNTVALGLKRFLESARGEGHRDRI